MLDTALLIAEVEKTGYTAVLPAPPAPEGAQPDGEEPDPELTALRQRLIVSAVLAVPVAVLSMIPALQFDYWGFASLVLAAPVVVWVAGGEPGTFV